MKKYLYRLGIIIALFSTCYGARPTSNGEMWDRLAEATKDTPPLHVDVLRAKAKDSAAEKKQLQEFEDFKRSISLLCSKEQKFLSEFMRMFKACVNSTPEAKEQKLKLLSDTFSQPTAVCRELPEKLKERANRDLETKIREGIRANNLAIRRAFISFSSVQESVPQIQLIQLFEGIEFPKIVIE